MTAPDPAALADLARALTDLGFVLRRHDADGFEVHVRSGEPDESGANLVIMDGYLPNFCGPIGPLAWQALDAIRRWQAPPRPEAAAFAEAVSRFEQACFDCGFAGSPERAEFDASKAALLAFAPSADAATITALERIARCAAALFESGGIYDDSFWSAHEELANALDAVAAARQRATGSGVRADE